MDIIIQFAQSLWYIMLELSWSLLIGMFVAGLLHVFIPSQAIASRMSGTGIKSVLWSVVAGVPMPLCSCGVIPAGLSLRQKGASKGATTGFLISTPQTGVDSILVTAAFLGWPFALFKVVAAAVTGIIGGSLANRVDDGGGKGQVQPMDEVPAKSLKEIVHYGIFGILKPINNWLVASVLISAAITAFIPPGSLGQGAFSQGVLGMLAVLVIAVPLYVCTTGSVPLAAGLIASGLPAGSALVFLMAGPATNVATMGAVLRVLGKKTLAVYLGTVIVFSMIFGWFFQWLLPGSGDVVMEHAHGAGWFEMSAAVAVSSLMVILLVHQFYERFIMKKPHVHGEFITLNVTGMTCDHCAMTVTRQSKAVDGVDEAMVDRSSGSVTITPKHGESVDVEKVKANIREAGYGVE